MKNYSWKFERVGLDRYTAYRDGVLMFTCTSTELRRVGLFRREHAELMNDLDRRGVAMREIARGNIRQLA